MISSLAFKQSSVMRSAVGAVRTFAAKKGQAEVILVGCGAPNRGMLRIDRCL